MSRGDALAADLHDPMPRAERRHASHLPSLVGHLSSRSGGSERVAGWAALRRQGSGRQGTSIAFGARSLQPALLFLWVLLLALPASAQERAIRLVVPFAAGGGADAVARAVAQG